MEQLTLQLLYTPLLTPGGKLMTFPVVRTALETNGMHDDDFFQPPSTPVEK